MRQRKEAASRVPFIIKSVTPNSKCDWKIRKLKRSHWLNADGETQTCFVRWQPGYVSHPHCAANVLCPQAVPLNRRIYSRIWVSNSPRGGGSPTQNIGRYPPQNCTNWSNGTGVVGSHSERKKKGSWLTCAWQRNVSTEAHVMDVSSCDAIWRNSKILMEHWWRKSITGGRPWELITLPTFCCSSASCAGKG